MKHLFVKTACILVLLATIVSCSSLGYYSQAVVGHSKLMWSRLPIDQALETTEGESHRLLALTPQVLALANGSLGMRNNGSYEDYVPLDRDYPVWNVIAAEEFSLSAKTWCYPVIGCAAYRGYFNQGSAQKYANRLKSKGYETTVAGASAYSTLGWFKDPVLPSMLRYGEGVFVETLLHEIAHQQFYADDSTEFNEAFATVVGEHGARIWLKQHAPEKLLRYQQQIAAGRDFDSLLALTRLELTALYEKNLSDQQKRQQKLQLLSDLQLRYNEMKVNRWHGHGWFDKWLETPVNNARLVAIANYQKLVPQFEHLLKQCDADVSAMIHHVQRYAGEPASIAALQSKPCQKNESSALD